MDLICYPKSLSGTLPAISSKSYAHRILICAALADKPTEVFFSGELSEDIKATIRCLTALGTDFEIKEQSVLVSPLDQNSLPEKVVLDCGESGATLRFILPLAGALGSPSDLTGAGRLPQRPLSDLLKALRQGGLVVKGDSLPLSIGGRLKQTSFSLPGNVSSQYISGLLFALALTGGSIDLESPLESSLYVHMTIEVLALFNIKACETAKGFFLPGRQEFKSPGKILVEGDWSNAAFFLTGGALGGPVALTGLRESSLQGDKEIINLLKTFEATTGVQDKAFYSQRLQRPADYKSLGQMRLIDAREIPDLVPILAVIAAVSPGTTRIEGAIRLRIKESDRLKTVANMIQSLGGDIEEGPDFLLIHGKPGLKGGTITCFQDHRIVMAGAIASCVCESPVILRGAEAVSKSYPEFFEDFRKLGGKCHVINNR